MSIFQIIFNKKICLILIFIFISAQFLLPINLVKSQSDFASNSNHIYVCNGAQATAIKGNGNNGFSNNNEFSFTSSDYDKIELDNNNFVTFSTMAYISANQNGYAYNFYNFTIKDNINNISKIDVTWKGYGGSENQSGHKEYGYSLWVKENNQYENKASGTSNNKDVLTASYTGSQIQDIINNNHLFVWVQSDYPVIRNFDKNDPNNQESFVISYYIEVNVSLNQILKNLDVSNPETVEEGGSFLVSVSSNSIALEDANVEFNNQNYQTNSEGIASITNAPSVLSDTIYSITVTKSGFYNAESSIIVTNPETPSIKELVIVCSDSIYEKSNFEISVFSENMPVENVLINFDNNIYYTNSEGVANLIAPEVESNTDFLISASKSGYISDKEYISVLDEFSMSVVIISPNGGEVFSEYLEIVWSIFNAPSEEYFIKLEYKRIEGTFNTIVENILTTDTSYIWDISDISNHNDYLIKITISYNSEEITDTSDSTFIISNPEEVVDGWVYGLVVEDESLTPIEDVLVCIKSDNENICRYTTIQGYQIFISEGIYDIQFSKNGYESKSYENIEVSSNYGTALDIILIKSELQEPQSFTDYSISEEIKKGSIIGSVDFSEKLEEINLYDDINIELISSNINSDEGLRIKISKESHEENFGKKLVLYLGEIQDPDNIIVKYDGIEIHESSDTESFFENNYMAYIKTFSEENGVIKTIIIINIPSFSEHFIDISLAEEVISKFIFDTNMIILYFSLMIITAVAAIFHIKYMWKN